jgi:tRNA threonylcarbamoyl adenosine modification protein YeaZ
MLNDSENKVTLAIETAVLGGSLAVVSRGEVLDHWLGGDDVSRSEDLIVSIAALLDKNGLHRRDIEIIAVSTGPGSYTGIRVGIATALGLKNALNITCVGVPVLEAMALGETSSNNIVTAVPVARGDICWRSFGGESNEIVSVEKLAVFLDFLSSNVPDRVVVHEQIFGQLIAEKSGVSLENAGTALSRYIGLAAKGAGTGADLTPIYVRDFV